MNKISQITTKGASAFMLLAFAVGSFGGLTPVAHAIAVPNWNASGNYVLNMQFNGSSNLHDMFLTQDNTGSLTGNGGSPAGANVYQWAITSGSVSGNAINITANYTATADAVTPQTVLNLTGTIAPNGTISGTWSDNYQGGDRSGTFSTTSGNAVAIPATVDVATNAATVITSTNATLNGTNGTNAASGHSFWASLNTFSVDAPVLPANVYSTIDLASVSANTAFSANLSAVVGMPAVTPSTTYYFVAWSFYNGAWHHGDIMNFTTLASSTDGTIGGTVTGGATVGILGVTSVQTITSSATANGTFANGWKYVFNITVPTNEPNLAMKFANWTLNGGSSTIPVANNMRISSLQANNAGATILLTAANTYSSPTLHMTGDLDAGTDRMQVQVTVETAIPLNSVNGAYSTSYGVKTN